MLQWLASVCRTAVDAVFNVIPRLSEWAIVAAMLLASLAWTHPAQMAVILYKCVLVILAVVLGYWIDRRLFPYGRPHLFLPARGSGQQITTAAALIMLRRTIVVLACILGLTMGL